MENYHYKLPCDWVELRSENMQNMFKDGFLCVIHCDKIPPHIGLLVSGKFYSWKSTGKDIDLDASLLLKIIDQKNIATLFFQLTHPLDIDAIRHLFIDLPSCIRGDHTCLHPFILLLGKGKEAKHIGELLEDLESQDLISRVFGLNLPKDYSGIPFYTREEINKRIDFLKHVKRKEGIS